MRCKILAVSGMLCFFLLVSGCIQSMIYQPSSEIVRTPADIGLEYESVWIETSDGIDISGWWVPVPDAQKTVLFFHGNAGNMADRLDTIRIASNLKLAMFIIDYRGFGKSGGSPSEKGLYRDADAAMAYLVESKKVDPASIILWGRSLGGAVAAKTAAKHEAGMLILESTFTSMHEAANDIFPWIPVSGWLLRNHSYNTIKHLENIDIPVLVIHSPEDEVICISHGRRLYDSISGSRYFVEIRGSHNHGYLASIDDYKAGIKNFISAAKKGVKTR